ncbi:MAG: aspartate aminotransferase [Halobacteriovoraceae bacterium]|nr:aspartate aminotransferase [Halobacteriovoraceae bacterium]|tara:strand:+ start:42055 stop:43245 length:1191 start_codon:yes stop_codon:yes gene_type:complete
MGKISDRAKNMAESATLKMARLAGELKEQGKDIISLSLGEPDFNVPEYIKAAAKQAIDDNFSHYPPVPGYKDFREVICNKFKNENGLNYTPEQIVVSTGAKHSLMNIMLAVVNPGDEVVLPAPYWVSYIEMVKFAEGKPVIIDTSIETDFKITPEQLKGALSPKTKAFVFSNPCNPSGSSYTKEELSALVEVFKEHDCYIVSDEIYEYINFVEPNTSLGCFEEIKDRVITVNGVSKGFAMTGWRIGFIGAPLEVAKACAKVQGQFTSGANAIAQRASLVALRDKKDEVKKMRDVFLQRRDLLIELLSPIEGLKLNVPQGAFYLFPDVSGLLGKSANGKKINNVGELCEFLLEDCMVATTPGDAFGCPKNIRISYANSEEQLKEAAKRIKNSLGKLS